MDSIKTLFHLLETILQTSTSDRKLAALSVTGRKSLITGVPQGSILRPLFFNIFINVLFLFTNKSEICNYANDNTLYSANKNISQIISGISNDFETLTKWFYDNYVLNLDKCHKHLDSCKLKVKCSLQNFKLYRLCLSLVNAFVKSRFSYCPLIRMFCTRESNCRLYRVHERALRIISEDYISSFSDLITLLNEKTIHQRCINFLMTEVC